MGKIIDVSKWQGAVNWKEVAKDDVDFVILRASCGITKDAKFEEYARGCQQNGIPFGVYHYSCAQSNALALYEIKTFYNTAKSYRPLFWVLDIEDPGQLYANGKSLPMRTGFAALISYLYTELRKRVGSKGRIIYYGGESVYEPYGRLSTIPWDGLWIANYSKTPRMAHDLHQYTSKGKVKGISGNVDMSRLSGDKGLDWWLNKTAVPAEALVPAASDGKNADTNGDGYIVRITKASTWNIRKGPGTEYESTGLFASVGSTYDYIATAYNGWLAIMTENGIGWVSNTCAAKEAKKNA